MGKVHVIDTPGFTGDRTIDKEITKKVLHHLRSVKYVDSFVLVFNSNSPRFSQNEVSMMMLYLFMFGEEYMNNCSIVFTRWEEDKKAQFKRK